MKTEITPENFKKLLPIGTKIKVKENWTTLHDIYNHSSGNANSLMPKIELINNGTCKIIEGYGAHNSIRIKYGDNRTDCRHLPFNIIEKINKRRFRKSKKKIYTKKENK